jgi:hypothetical protein
MAPYSIKYTFQILVVQMVESDHNHHLVHELIIFKHVAKSQMSLKLVVFTKTHLITICYQLKALSFTP